MDLTLRLRWCAATTLGLALAGFGVHFPGSSEIGTGVDDGAPTSLGRVVVAIAGARALTAAMALLPRERDPLTMAASIIG